MNIPQNQLLLSTDHIIPSIVGSCFAHLN